MLLTDRMKMNVIERDYMQGKISPTNKQINEQMNSNYLDTKDLVLKESLTITLGLVN